MAFFYSRYLLETTDKQRNCVLGRIQQKSLITNIFFDLTYRCNLNCKICLIKDHNSPREKDELSLHTINQILTEARSLGFINVFFSGGEVFLRPDFLDIYLRAISKGFSVHIYSNLTLLNQPILECFQKHPPATFKTTVYGLSQKTYEAVTMTRGSFYLFMKNLKLIRRSNIRLVLQFTCCRSNIKEFKKFLQFPIESYERKRCSFVLSGRIDRNPSYNIRIKQEMLPPDELASYLFKYELGKKVLPPPHDNMDLGPIKLFRNCVRSNTVFINPAKYCMLCYELRLPGYKRLYVPGKLNDIVKFLLVKKQNTLMPDIKCRNCDNSSFCGWCPLYADSIVGNIAPVPYLCRFMKHLNLLGWPQGYLLTQKEHSFKQTMHMVSAEVKYAKKRKKQQEQ